MHNTVLVTGASSQLGVFVLPRLRSAGYEVLAISRRAPDSPVEVSPGVHWASPAPPGDGERRPVRHLVSCGPLELALDCLRYYPGLKTAVVFSSSSVWTKAASPLKAESGHMADIAAAEKALLRLCSERGVDLLLLRPTLIWGCGLDRNISLLARFGRRFGFIPVSGDAQGLRQPVHADDLARLAVRALGSEPPLAMQSAVCGGSTLTYRAMVRLIAEACPGPVRLLTLPRGLLSSLVSLPALLPAYRGINAEMVNRQSQDMTFDDSLLRDALNAQARSFEPSPADFEIPAYARALQLPV